MSVEVNNESGVPVDEQRLVALALFALDALRIHPQAELSLLLVDDLIATGGTLVAAVNLVRRMGAQVFEAASIIDLPELGGSTRLQEAGVPTFCLTEFSLTE